MTGLRQSTLKQEWGSCILEPIKARLAYTHAGHVVCYENKTPSYWRAWLTCTASAHPHQCNNNINAVRSSLFIVYIPTKRSMTSFPFWSHSHVTDIKPTQHVGCRGSKLAGVMVRYGRDMIIVVHSPCSSELDLEQRQGAR